MFEEVCLAFSTHNISEVLQSKNAKMATMNLRRSGVGKEKSGSGDRQAEILQPDSGNYKRSGIGDRPQNKNTSIVYITSENVPSPSKNSLPLIFTHNAIQI